MPHLSEKEAVILQDVTEIRFTDPGTHKRCVVKRSQLPLVPAFAITAHKAQGKTLSKVIVDLQNCRGCEPPYVMLSHVKSLSGLLILHPFDFAQISSCPSEDLHKEFQHLTILNKKTLMSFADHPILHHYHEHSIQTSDLALSEYDFCDSTFSASPLHSNEIPSKHLLCIPDNVTNSSSTYDSSEAMFSSPPQCSNDIPQKVSISIIVNETNSSPESSLHSALSPYVYSDTMFSSPPLNSNEIPCKRSLLVSDSARNTLSTLHKCQRTSSN
ncbi:hypothetical protein BDQ17DRAFT_1254664 [Cyathus striatus]|nr:hypothetical protein BDQ17DRAFT_1254664 [Cyathus striatus]